MIEPLLPNKPRGVSSVNDRRTLNGIRQQQAATVLRGAARDGGAVIGDEARRR